MLDFIPSEYYRKYCEENGIEFSDREKAAIIWNCPELDLLCSFLYKKLEMLKKLAAETDDEELKAEIGRLLTYYEELDKEMRDNSDKSCIYHTTASEFCLDFEEAFQVSLELGQNNSQYIPKYPGTVDVIMIRKVPIYRKPTSNESSKDGIGIFYDYEGRMLKCDGVHTFVGKILSKNYVFKHPFKRGDIVMDVFSRQIGVVEDIITKLPPYLKINIDKHPYFFRFGISVEFITRSGKFRAETICPAELEKLESFDREGSEADMLRTAAAILRGEPSDNEKLDCGDGLLFKLTTIHSIISRETEKDHRIFADDKKD